MHLVYIPENKYIKKRKEMLREKPTDFFSSFNPNGLIDLDHPPIQILTLLGF